MAFISTREEETLVIEDKYYLEECVGCETGVDYMGAHMGNDGFYHKFCCTREAEIERMTNQFKPKSIESK